MSNEQTINETFAPVFLPAGATAEIPQAAQEAAKPAVEVDDDFERGLRSAKLALEVALAASAHHQGPVDPSALVYRARLVRDFISESTPGSVASMLAETRADCWIPAALLAERLGFSPPGVPKTSRLLELVGLQAERVEKLERDNRVAERRQVEMAGEVVTALQCGAPGEDAIANWWQVVMTARKLVADHGKLCSAARELLAAAPTSLESDDALISDAGRRLENARRAVAGLLGE